MQVRDGDESGFMGPIGAPNALLPWASLQLSQALWVGVKQPNIRVYGLQVGSLMTHVNTCGLCEVGVK